MNVRWGSAGSWGLGVRDETSYPARGVSAAAAPTFPFIKLHETGSLDRRSTSAAGDLGRLTPAPSEDRSVGARNVEVLDFLSFPPGRPGAASFRFAPDLDPQRSFPPVTADAGTS